MHKIIITLILAAIALPGIAQAQGNRIDANISVKQELRASTTKQQERKAEIQAKLNANAAKRISNHLSGIIRGLKSRIARLTQISDRVSEAIVNAETKGQNVLTAKASLESAKAELRNASTTVASIEAKVNVSLASSTPRAAYAEIKTLMLSAHQDIRNAHKALKDSIKDLRIQARATTTSQQN